MSKCWANIDKNKGGLDSTLNVFFDKNLTGENRMVKISISNPEKNISKEVVLVQKSTREVFFGEYSEVFKKNDCIDGGEGSDVILTERDVDCYPVVSFVSQEDANDRVRELLMEQGQEIANNRGYCTWQGKYSKKFTNECDYCQVGEEITVTEEDMDEYPFLSTISKSDADRMAEESVIANGQAFANKVGICTDMYRGEYEKVFYKNNCEECMKDSDGYKVTAEMTSGYPYCDTDESSANEKAKKAVESEGQEIANKNSSCLRINDEPLWEDQGDVYCNGCESVIRQIDTRRCSPTYNTTREIPRSGVDCSKNGEWSEWETFCDGYTEKRRRLNSCGATEEEVVLENSENCGYIVDRNPKWEKFEESYCQNCLGYQKYVDTNVNSPTYNNTKVLEEPSKNCDNSGEWTDWDTYCDGKGNLRKTRVNACGAEEDELVESDSSECKFTSTKTNTIAYRKTEGCECPGIEVSVGTVEATMTSLESPEDADRLAIEKANDLARQKSEALGCGAIFANMEVTRTKMGCPSDCTPPSFTVKAGEFSGCSSEEVELKAIAKAQEEADKMDCNCNYEVIKTNTIAYRKTEGCECQGEEVAIGTVEGKGSSSTLAEAERLAIEKANENARAKAEALGCGTVYYNKEVTKYKEGCGSNCVAPSYTVKAGVHKACTQAEAQTLADNEAQRLANEMKCDCTYTSTKTNTKNFCKDGYGESAKGDQCICQGKCVYIGEVSASATSKESQDDADAKAEALANENAKKLADTYECGDVYYSEASVITKQKNDCGAWCTGSMVDYPVEAGIKFSCISPDDANSKRNVEMESNDYQNKAQSYANAHGSCNCPPEPGTINVYVTPSKSGIVSFSGSISSTNGIVDSVVSVEDITGSKLVSSNSNVSPGVYNISVEGSATMRCTTESGEASTDTTYSLSSSSVNVESGGVYSVYIEVNSDCSQIEETVYADDINVTVYRSNESCQNDASYGANCVGDQYTYFVDGSKFSGRSKVEANNKRDAWVSSSEGRSIMQAEANSKGTCTCPSTDDCEISVSSDVYANASIDYEFHMFHVSLFHRISSINCSPGGCGDYIFNMSLSEDGTSNIHDNQSLTYSCGQTTDDFTNTNGYYLVGLSAMLPERYWAEPDSDEFYDGLSYTINTYSSSSNKEATLTGGAHTISINVTDVHTGNNGPFS